MDRFFGLDRVSPHDDNVVLLTTAYDPVQVFIVRSILDGENIPYLIRERGSGGSVKVIAGYSTFGSDIFVPKDLEERAKEILDAYGSAPVEEEADGEEL